jgi:hypothetical protein
MRRGLRSLVAAVVLMGAGSASAVELNYKWKKGDVHRFRYEDDTTVQMKMAGMEAMGGMMPGMGAGGMDMKLKVQSQFSQRVLSVRPDGTADVEFTLEQMDLFQGGNKVASMTQVPPAARKVTAEVDRKGRARFYRMVTVYMQEQVLVVGVRGVAQAGPNGARASVSDGERTLEVVAAVNPKTGAITASMTETKTAKKAPPPPALRAVRVKEEDPGVDVLPKQIFEMMVLPEGDMAPGSRADVTTPFGDIAVTFREQTDKVARIQTQMAGKKVEAPAEATAEAPGELGAGDTEDVGEDSDGAPQMGGMAMGGMPAGMPAGMPGMPGAGGAKKGARPGAAPAAGMKMDLDVTSGFDVAAGRLLSIEGTGGMDMDLGGGGAMKQHSRFTLSRM